VIWDYLPDSNCDQVRGVAGGQAELDGGIFQFMDMVGDPLSYAPATVSALTSFRVAAPTGW
jgi:hypothetical protein